MESCPSPGAAHLDGASHLPEEGSGTGCPACRESTGSSPEQRSPVCYQVLPVPVPMCHQVLPVPVPMCYQALPTAYSHVPSGPTRAHPHVPLGCTCCPSLFSRLPAAHPLHHSSHLTPHMLSLLLLPLHCFCPSFSSRPTLVSAWPPWPFSLLPTPEAGVAPWTPHTGPLTHSLGWELLHSD